MLLASGAGSIFARQWIGEAGKTIGEAEKTLGEAGKTLGGAGKTPGGAGTAEPGKNDPRRVRWAIGAIAAVILLYLFILPPLLTSLVGLAFSVKLALTALLLVPLGFAMGMPFPTGLQVVAFASEGSASTEWAWAMNAASSVFGSVLAMVIAINFGLGATLAAGAVAYLAALLLTRTWSAPASSS